MPLDDPVPSAFTDSRSCFYSSFRVLSTNKQDYEETSYKSDEAADIALQNNKELINKIILIFNKILFKIYFFPYHFIFVSILNQGLLF